MQRCEILDIGEKDDMAGESVKVLVLVKGLYFYSLEGGELKARVAERYFVKERRIFVIK